MNDSQKEIIAEAKIVCKGNKNKMIEYLAEKASKTQTSLTLKEIRFDALIQKLKELIK